MAIASIVRESVKNSLNRYDDLLSDKEMLEMLFDGSGLSNMLRQVVKQEIIDVIAQATYEALGEGDEHQAEKAEDEFNSTERDDNEEVH